MLPSPESRFFRPAILSALLVLGSVLLALIPARHGLSEIWPGRIDEIVYLDGGLDYRSALARTRSSPDVLTVSQPISLLAVELNGGERVHGFRLPAPDDDQMLLETGAAESAVIDPVQIRRAYHPNAMTLTERLGLMLSRLADRRRQAAPGISPAAPSMPVHTPDSGESDNLPD